MSKVCCMNCEFLYVYSDFGLCKARDLFIELDKVDCQSCDLFSEWWGAVE